MFSRSKFGEDWELGALLVPGAWGLGKCLSKFVSNHLQNLGASTAVLLSHAHVAKSWQEVVRPAVPRLLLRLLVLQILGLLGGDLVLQVADLLLVLRYLHRERQEGLVAGSTRPLALLSNHMLLLVTLQLLNLLKQLVEQEKGLGCQRLVEDLWVEVSSLNGHLDLLDEHPQL